MKKLSDWIAQHLVAWLVGSGLLITASAVVLMVDFSKSYRPPAGEEQPKITDWMQAWGSIGAVIAGVLAALAAGALLVEVLGRVFRLLVAFTAAWQTVQRPRDRAQQRVRGERGVAEHDLQWFPGR
ncbi:hypothetical protein AB0K35_04505 [Micromonospora sp. NPDC053740]|uniref:hypothetical protein n=1 Tax=Micromonospora sp. NPDC053740 TaxID=3155173 RepID=UPI00343118E8